MATTADTKTSNNSKDSTVKTAPVVNPKNPTNIKPCCACPDTKRQRDECVMLNGLDSESCTQFIEQHKECMRGYGFKV